MYSKKTFYYEIPYMGYGDMMTQQSNQRQMSIIDNLLYAATFGASKCIIQDGKYSLQKDGEFYRLKVSPLNGNHSLVGILNYRLFDVKGNIVSQVLLKGYYYYVYICYTTMLETNPEAIMVQCSRYNKPLDNTKLKICQVDLTGEQPKIITDVDKVLAKNILAHTQDRTNPHGKELIQEEIKVLNKLTLDDEKIYPVVYQKLKTNGLSGVTWFKEGYRPVFVTVYGEQFIGHVYWKINEDNTVTIYNTGQIDKNMNVRIQIQKE